MTTNNTLNNIAKIAISIVIIIGLVLIIQYKTIEIERQDAYDINLSVYQSSLNSYNVQLDGYDRDVIYHASQIKTVDGTQTDWEIETINTDGDILVKRGINLYDESIRLDECYRQLNIEKNNLSSSPINLLQDMYQQRLQTEEA